MMVYIVIENWPHGEQDVHVFNNKKAAHVFIEKSKNEFPKNIYKVPQSKYVSLKS